MGVKQLGSLSCVLWLLLTAQVIAQGTKDDGQGGSATPDLAIPLGKTVSEFTFSQSGTLSYKGKPFNPAVKVKPDSVQSFRISLNKDKERAGAIAEDLDGQNSLYLLELDTHSATPLQKPGTWSAAQQVFWSPSGRYMLALCTYEGQRFIGIDLKTKQVTEGDFLGSEGKLWRISDEPRWAKDADILTFTVEETCSPYDDPNCDPERVLARYSISLDPATLKATAAKKTK